MINSNDFSNYRIKHFWAVLLTIKYMRIIYDKSENNIALVEEQ